MDGRLALFIAEPDQPSAQSEQSSGGPPEEEKKAAPLSESVGSWDTLRDQFEGSDYYCVCEPPTEDWDAVGDREGEAVAWTRVGERPEQLDYRVGFPFDKQPKS
jgi:hypothetical protein